VPVRPLGQIWSTYPPAWRHEDVKRRTVGVGIFPSTTVLLRLVRRPLVEQANDAEVADQDQAVGKPRIT
jgi:hypothetical protein